MAKYTVELRRVCEQYGRCEVEKWFKDYSLSDYLRADEINVIERTGIWNKDRLAKKIVNHYFMREIGFETPALFRHYVKFTMDEIMERKLPLIYSSAIKYDPLVNVDYTETYERNIGTKGASNSSSSNNATGLSVNSDTPQGQINKTEILNGKFASNTTASDTESNILDTSTTSSDTDETYTKRIKGNSGVSATAQKMIEQYRDNIIAIDEDIIKELNTLFMGIY